MNDNANNLLITEIQLVPIRAQNGLTFFASCVLDNRFFLGNIAVYTKIDGSGFRLVYPTKVLKNGQQVPIYYPIDKQVGEALQEAISQEALSLLSLEGME